jgi:NADH-quinone oxidoreductase subunit C
MSIEAAEKIKGKFPEAVEETHSQAGDDTVRVQRDSWFSVLEFVRKTLGFDLFVDLTAVDYLAREEGLPRFEVVVHLRNMATGKRIRVKSRLPESDPSIQTLCPLWKGANWFERECHEMYGILFKDSPDLRHLLLYNEFEGHPLRKDYPIDKRQPRIQLLASEERRFSRPADETPHGHDPRLQEKP